MRARRRSLGGGLGSLGGDGRRRLRSLWLWHQAMTFRSRQMMSEVQQAVAGSDQDLLHIERLINEPMTLAPAGRLTFDGSHRRHFTPHRTKPSLVWWNTVISAAGNDRLVLRSDSSNQDGT